MIYTFSQSALDKMFPYLSRWTLDQILPEYVPKDLPYSLWRDVNLSTYRITQIVNWYNRIYLRNSNFELDPTTILDALSLAMDVTPAYYATRGCHCVHYALTNMECYGPTQRLKGNHYYCYAHLLNALRKAPFGTYVPLFYYLHRRGAG